VIVRNFVSANLLLFFLKLHHFIIVHYLTQCNEMAQLT
jgi:hypothetical protein